MNVRQILLATEQSFLSNRECEADIASYGADSLSNRECEADIACFGAQFLE